MSWSTSISEIRSIFKMGIAKPGSRVGEGRTTTPPHSSGIRRTSAEPGPSFLDVAAPASQQSSRKLPLVPFLALTLLLPTMIVIGNFIIGVLTPLTAGADDDMTLIDSTWRLVQGQHLGIDFHDPRGFGLFQVAALLWRLLGPHYYVMRAAADLFAFVIILCGSVVAARQLRYAAGLAALFCVAVALVASGPSLYGMHEYFGLTVVYDRLLMSALLVLFAQSFANDLDIRAERNFIDYFIAAVLLNTLFLAKISGLAVGVAIVVAGSILRGPGWRNFVEIFLVLMFLAVMIWFDFAITGTSLSGVIQEYRMAAQGRVGTVSTQGVLWFGRRLTVLAVVGLMALYAVSRPIKEDSDSPLWRCLCIIAFYWICQVVLNMSNGSASDLISLAPGAAVAIVTWTDTAHAVSFWNRLWTKVHLRRLDEISARQLIPLFILAMVAGPEAYASLRAVKLDYAISSGATKSIIVSANKGITLNIVKDTYASPSVPYLNDGIRAIVGLGAIHDRIANLDFDNPFPAMFLAPDPKGVWVWWDFSRATNVPIGYRPSWQEVIGDACIVTEPKQSPTGPMKYYSEPLIKAVGPHLATAFTLVYEDDIWRIWKRRDGCGAPDG
jgi:hypothetical protein